MVSGRLDTPAATRAQQEIVPLLEQADRAITLDCSALDYISSSGLRLFLAIRKEAATRGGTVVIRNINGDITKVFQMTGFYNLFDIR